MIHNLQLDPLVEKTVLQFAWEQGKSIDQVIQNACIRTMGLEGQVLTGDEIWAAPEEGGDEKEA